MYKRQDVKYLKTFTWQSRAFNPLNRLAFVHVLLENTKFDCDDVKLHHAAHLETSRADGAEAALLPSCRLPTPGSAVRFSAALPLLRVGAATQ